MIRSFQLHAQAGAGNATELADRVSRAAIPGTIGLILMASGLIFLLISLFAQKYRTQWFFWFMIALSLLLLTGYPIGTVIGAFLLIYLIVKRKEFLAPAYSQYSQR